jgi:energy-coupling factor transporter ATP-binding protein EcfA2
MNYRTPGVAASFEHSLHGSRVGSAAALWRFQQFQNALTERHSWCAGHREATLRLRGDASALIDLIEDALAPAWQVHRTGARELVLQSGDQMLCVDARPRRDHCELFVASVAPSRALAQANVERVRALVADRRTTPQGSFTVKWHFRDGRGALQAVAFQEPIEAQLLEAAYPTLRAVGGVHAFIARYLAAPECILVLQGPPGTGKTQLIRAIAGALTQRKRVLRSGGSGSVNHCVADADGDDEATLFYSNDERVLNSDEFYVEFATGTADAIVIEDADNALKARANGNAELHRVLGMSDGLFGTRGRKIIFSTNLPNVRDLDDALVRPGRCHAHLHLRPLVPDEAQRLLDVLAPEGGGPRALLPVGPKQFTVAEIYRAARSADSGAERVVAGAGGERGLREAV